MSWTESPTGTWNNGNKKVTKGQRLDPSQDPTPDQTDRAIDVYHCYCDGIYIAQRNDLASAKTACEE